MQTHEHFLQEVRNAVLALADLNPTERALLNTVKLAYGSGPNGTRGVTFFNRWNPAGGAAIPFVEVSAFGQESVVQLAGTTVHELGHVLAGWEAGHSKGWHEACQRLGLRKIKAAGTNYLWANFTPALRAAVTAITPPTEGQPVCSLAGLLGPAAGLAKLLLKPCGAGIGTRGGKSRGKGSGSRLRLFECDCERPVKVRLACDTFDAVHNPCGGTFHRV